MNYREKVIKSFQKDFNWKTTQLAGYKRFIQTNVEALKKTTGETLLGLLNDNKYGLRFVKSTQYNWGSEDNSSRIDCVGFGQVLYYNISEPYNMNVSYFLQPTDRWHGDKNKKMETAFLLIDIFNEKNILQTLNNIFKKDLKTFYEMNEVYQNQKDKMYLEYRKLVDKYSLEMEQHFLNGDFISLGMSYMFDYRNDEQICDGVRFVCEPNKRTGILELYDGLNKIYTYEKYRASSLLRECRGFMYQNLPSPQ